MGIVYRAMNRVNGKSYIGITTGRLERRQWGHTYEVRHGSKKPFHSAIRKYGLDAFDWIVIEEHETDADLMAAEIRLIAELRPEYNIAKGGKGVAGLRHSEETRAKMRAALVAFSARRKGYKHRPETVARLSEVGLQNRDKWEQYRAMGPAASSRAVICLDDGKEYPSASAASRAYGLDKSIVQAVCQGRKSRLTAGGRRFAYLDGSTPAPRPNKSCKLDATKVAEIKQRLRMGESAPAIAEAFGVNKATISDIKTGKSWRSVEECDVRT